jgi:cbb3-type cytochrome oxidase subunit 3
MFIITEYTYISIIYQKKRREKLKNEWNGILIIRVDEHDVSQSCGSSDGVLIRVGTVVGSCPAQARLGLTVAK